jgi:hypothetical protein
VEPAPVISTADAAVVTMAKPTTAPNIAFIFMLVPLF